MTFLSEVNYNQANILAASGDEGQLLVRYIKVQKTEGKKTFSKATQSLSQLLPA